MPGTFWMTIFLSCAWTFDRRAPQAQSNGSTSKIFLTSRAHVLRASLEKPASSSSGWASALVSALGLTADDVVALARLLYAP